MELAKHSYRRSDRASKDVEARPLHADPAGLAVFLEKRQVNRLDHS
jgi:hypothetical protein